MTNTHSQLQQKLESGGFALTSEVCPPKGSDCAAFITEASKLAGIVDALNVTDNQGAHMRISPLAASALLIREGIEPVCQLTCRDRNRLALQSDLLGAAAIGVRNILALTGDHIAFGDHPEAKAVFDLDSVQLIETAAKLCKGTDLTGKKLHGSPDFFIGAAAAPQAEPFELSLLKLRKKVLAGASFFQTQAIFDPSSFVRFSSAVAPLGTKVIAGILVLKSAGTARFINANIPGLSIPDQIIQELESSTAPAAKGVEIACRMAAAVKPHCHGIHIMPMGQDEAVPEIAAAARTA